MFSGVADSVAKLTARLSRTLVVSCPQFQVRGAKLPHFSPGILPIVSDENCFSSCLTRDKIVALKIEEDTPASRQAAKNKASVEKRPNAAERPCKVADEQSRVVSAIA